MFSALEACDFDKIRNYFEYIEIDDESRTVLDEYGIVKEYKKNMPEKWCVNVDRQIAFLELQYVSAGIVRMDHNECYREYLFAVHDGYGIISVYHTEGIPGNFKSPRVNWKERWDHSRITVPILLELLEEAMKVYKMGKLLDYRYHHIMRKGERLKNTPDKILHGAFSTTLQEMFNHITELTDAEQKFRNVCLKHFVEWNVEEQRYCEFYLHDDEDSFFIFDILLWAYLHMNSSLEQLKQDWAKIVNEENKYTDLYTKHFCINGPKEYFFEKYLNKRTEEGMIILSGDVIHFAEGYPETILKHLI